jgi:Na+/H+ antiporter NhaD/arsenite permease-like protein
VGGLLTPLGDPPLFLGYLNGVPFFWTLSLWPQWLFVNGLVLAVFVVWDHLAFRAEPSMPLAIHHLPQRLAIRGILNILLLAGVIGGVLLEGWLAGAWAKIIGCAIMLSMACLSLRFTPSRFRAANSFSWEPIIEVAILFLAIFITMVPALDTLARHKDAFPLEAPCQYFWLTGGLSALLDNAPTYLTFATLAAGSTDFAALAHDQVPGTANGPLVLAAISCGAVFMGALTYIGNGPNFMVKAIAEHAGYPMPSFFGYLGYSTSVLVPVFVLVTLLFFWP